MKWKAMIWVAAVLMLAAGRAQADLTVIDFESLANGVVVDDQFLTLGVDFNSTAKALLSSLTFPASSGDKLI